MNLRILKKLSKKAAPLLAALGDQREQFLAEPGENYHSTRIQDRTCWERSRTVWKDLPAEKRDDQFCYRSRKGAVIVLRPPSSPLKGTPMVGATSGYYEPEWEEETAWDALQARVWAEFTDWNEDGPTPLRTFKGPGDILRAAQELARPA